MHREWYTLPPALEQQIAETRAAGGRIVKPVFAFPGGGGGFPGGGGGGFRPGAAP